jgi:hypothetical protein
MMTTGVKLGIIEEGTEGSWAGEVAALASSTVVIP